MSGSSLYTSFIVCDISQHHPEVGLMVASIDVNVRYRIRELSFKGSVSMP